MFSKQFLLDALERMLWTFVQTLLAIATVDGFFDQLNTDWQGTLTGAVVAALLSAVKSTFAAGVGEETPQAMPFASTYSYEGEADEGSRDIA
jgi:hypothetical protein